MPIYADFSIGKLEDGTLTVALQPPVAIGGWQIQFTVQKHFGGISGIYTAYVSGINSISGITITNSGQGIFNIALPSYWASGLDFGNYSYSVERRDSGFRTELSIGYILLGVNT